jgi:hypothetical protein
MKVYNGMHFIETNTLPKMSLDELRKMGSNMRK